MFRIFLILCFISAARFQEEINTQDANTEEVNTQDVNTEDHHDAETETTCSAPSCLEIQREYINSITRLTHPCDDFYSFVCSGWFNASSDNHGIPFKDQNHEVQKSIRTRFEGVLKSTNLSERSALGKMANFYRGCLDMEKRMEVGMTPLRIALNKVGGWPLIDGEFNNDYVWEEAIAKITSLFDLKPIIIGISLIKHPTDNTTYALKLMKSSLGRSRIANKSFHNISESPEDLKYMSVISQFVRSFDSRITDDEVKSDIEEIIEFEKKLERIITKTYQRQHTGINSTEYRRRGTVEWGTVHHFQAELQTINFTNLLQYFTYGYQESYVFTDEFRTFSLLGSLLEETNKRVLANYIGWRVVQELSAYTPYYQHYYGNYAQEDLCFHQTAKLMGYGLGHLYYKYGYSAAANNEIKEMTKEIIRVYIQKITEFSWIKNQTERSAITKLQNLNVVLPPMLVRRQPNVDNLYQDIENINIENYLQSAIDLHWNKAISKIRAFQGQPYVNYNWIDIFSWTVPFYDPTFNAIYIPPGFLESPLYDENFPTYINFAASGVRIAKTVMQVFTGKGRYYNENGNYQRWWSNFTLRGYLRSKKCFKDQFRIKYPDNNINFYKHAADHLYAENLAVNVVLKAYTNFPPLETDEEGYNEFLRGKKFLILQEMNVPIKYIFFVAYAYSRCEVREDYSLNSQFHQEINNFPQEIEVLSAIANNCQFFTEFSCQIRSNLFENKTCAYW